MTAATAPAGLPSAPRPPNLLNLGKPEQHRAHAPLDGSGRGRCRHRRHHGHSPWTGVDGRSPPDTLPTGCTRYAHRQPVMLPWHRSSEAPQRALDKSEEARARRPQDVGGKAGRVADGAEPGTGVGQAPLLCGKQQQKHPLKTRRGHVAAPRLSAESSHRGGYKCSSWG